ncbi:transketolase [Acidisphaera sp. S103]|uniref:transketolase n=1 Tax=Acidisphaera sp. S103 TaxID=1747223 RepID=UPI0020B15E26|nr:transketolase [Acidisphaera sp. S103]
MTEPAPRLLANALRFLAMDSVEKANSGHPGMPMGMADIAEVLWRHHLRHNPADPKWPGRDRFVLSNGHGSMLLYGLLHLTGYDLPMDELKQFRQLHSKTPGHPEYGLTPGIETTTGPLGQGLATAVGMALAEQQLALAFNRGDHAIVNHRTFVFCGDGCLMEGISHEACSFAGSMKLEKLIVFYDDNGISIDGHVDGWFNDDTPKRFEAYGWRVIRNVDGLDSEAVEVAVAEAVTPCGRPTLVCCKTIIGYGAPKLAGTHQSHGAALGATEVAATRAALEWPYPPFEVPADIRTAWNAHEAGAARQAEWQKMFDAYAAAFPAEAAEFKRRVSGALPADFAAKADGVIAEAAAVTDPIATRKTSQNAIQAFAAFLPEFFGGSADLTGSNLTNWKGCITIDHGKAGNYLHYGVREFGMCAMLSGIALHGGYIPFGGTFVTFSDYARNAIRLAALMGIRSIYVLTHDSIGLGEDGPTHQPIEHAASLRLIPGLDVWRPCDMLETAAAWRYALERQHGPSVLLLTRQNLPQHSGGVDRAALVARGGYVLSDVDGTPDVVLIATGSEVGITTGARDLLAARGVKARVVSMPCSDLFDRQDKAWRDSVLPPGIRRVAVEAGSTTGWYKYVGLEGAVVGIDRFGESAQGPAVMKYFGFTAEHVAEVVG